MSEIKNLTLSSSDISNFDNLTISLPNAGINNEPFNWNDFFKSVALQGLEKTNYFATNYHTFNGNNPLSVIQYSNVSNSGRYFFLMVKQKTQQQIVTNYETRSFIVNTVIMFKINLFSIII